MSELRNDESSKPGLYAKIYDVVRRIPPGRVATYGQIAYIVGRPRCARQVGWALAALWEDAIEDPVPWQRVVSAKGEVRMGSEQVSLLTAEGVLLDERGRIDLDAFGWDGLM